MGFFEKLEKIREKPVAYRQRVLVSSLIISMTLIIALWISLFGFEKNETVSGPKPWEVIRKTFETSKEEVKKNLPSEVYLRE